MFVIICCSFFGVFYFDVNNYNCDEVFECLKVFFFQFVYIVYDMDVDDNGELKKFYIYWVGQCFVCILDFVVFYIEILENIIEYCWKFKCFICYFIYKDSFGKFQYE